MMVVDRELVIGRPRSGRPIIPDYSRLATGREVIFFACFGYFSPMLTWIDSILVSRAVLVASKHSLQHNSPFTEK